MGDKRGWRLDFRKMKRMSESCFARASQNRTRMCFTTQQCDSIRDMPRTTTKSKRNTPGCFPDHDNFGRSNVILPDIQTNNRQITVQGEAIALVRYRIRSTTHTRIARLRKRQRKAWKPRLCFRRFHVVASRFATWELRSRLIIHQQP